MNFRAGWQYDEMQQVGTEIWIMQPKDEIIGVQRTKKNDESGLVIGSNERVR